MFVCVTILHVLDLQLFTIATSYSSILIQVLQAPRKNTSKEKIYSFIFWDSKKFKLHSNIWMVDRVNNLLILGKDCSSHWWKMSSNIIKTFYPMVENKTPFILKFKDIQIRLFSATLSRINFIWLTTIAILVHHYFFRKTTKVQSSSAVGVRRWVEARNLTSRRRIANIFAFICIYVLIIDRIQ